MVLNTICLAEEAQPGIAQSGAPNGARLLKCAVGWPVACGNWLLLLTFLLP